MKVEWKTLLRISACILLLYLAIAYHEELASLVSAILSAIFPLLIGAAIAYVINIPMSFFEKHYFRKSRKKIVKASRRPVCMIGAYITVLAVVALVIGLIMPQLAECVTLIIAEFPAMIQRLLDSAETMGFIPEKYLDKLMAVDWQSQINGIIDTLSSGLGNILGGVISIVSGVFSGIVTTVVSIIFSIYLLASKDKLREQCRLLLKHYTKDKWNDRIGYVLTVLDKCFRGYIVGQCTEALILGVLCTLGMLAFGFPYALMIGALIAFTALIPVAGGYIGAGIGAFMILTVSPLKALLFLVFIVILQQLEGNLIYPRVVGGSIGLPGIWVLAAVTVGGGIFGIAGMLLGVPIAAAIYRMISDDIYTKERRPSHRRS